MTQRTLWEEGHERGARGVALGVAATLTVAAIDLLVFDEITVLFDVCFVLLCLALALLVRPADLFVVGVLPPLLMVGAFTLLGLARAEVIADHTDSVVQAVVTGLGHHAGALVTGYGLSLAVLAIRHHMIGRRRDGRRPAQAAKRSGSPAPTRTTSG